MFFCNQMVLIMVNVPVQFKKEACVNKNISSIVISKLKIFIQLLIQKLIVAKF